MSILISTKRLLVLTTLVLFTCTASFAGLLTPISASVDLGMHSQTACGAVDDEHTQSWGPTLSSLTTSAIAVATCAQPDVTVTSSGALSASWNANTRAGQISFQNIGWQAVGDYSDAGASDNNGTDYTYKFSPTQDVLFTLNYNTASWGNYGGFGLVGFYVNLANTYFALVDPDSSGNMTWTLSAGSTYMLNIINYANLWGPIEGLNEHMNGNFDFTAQPISAPVPEPSSISLFGGGMLAFAQLLRKKFRG